MSHRLVCSPPKFLSLTINLKKCFNLPLSLFPLFLRVRLFCLIYSPMTAALLPPLLALCSPLHTGHWPIKSKYLTPFLFFIFPWGLFVSFLSECQASAWVSKQTSSSRNDVSENCHRLGMSCQSLCWANDYCWMLWELKVSNSGHFFFFFCSCYGLTHACAVGSLMSRFLILCPLVKIPVALWFVRLISLTCNRWRTKLITAKACEIPRTWL